MKQYKIITYHIIACLITSMFLNSCTTSKSVNLLQDIEPVYTSRPFTDYKLQYKDEIFCSIMTNNEDFSSIFNSSSLNQVISTGEQNINNSTPYTIYENGNITIPFFGDIHIAGKTIREAEEIIENKMRQAIPDARVKIILRNNMYYVVSDEQRGRYDIYKDNMTIYQALAAHGRPSSRIDLSKVKIIRADETGNSVVKTFDLRAESLIESEYYYIKPNDVIYYSTSNRAFFRIDSFTGLLAAIAFPITTVTAIFAIIGRYN